MSTEETQGYSVSRSESFRMQVSVQDSLVPFFGGLVVGAIISAGPLLVNRAFDLLQKKLWPDRE